MLIAYRRSENGKMQETADMQGADWVRVEKPSDEEIEKVAATLSLDGSLLRDALDQYEAPRFEVEDGTPYIFLRYPFSTEPAGTTPLLIAITGDVLVTFARGTPSFLDKIASQSHAAGKMEILIRIISEITARYSSGIINTQRSVNRRRHNVVDMSEQDILELTGDESTISMFLDALVPQGNVLARLASGKAIDVREEDHDRFEDLALSTSQLIDLGRALIRTMENTRNAYAAISTQRLNHIIRILTALTVIVTLPNVIIGIYGMNVPLPLADNPHAITIILLFTLIIVTVITVLFKRNKWL